jgi:hypothetical protein
MTIIAVMLCALKAGAQTTTFTYQGSLQASGMPANGNYDLQFKLFDLASGGVQQGSTLQLQNVAVANGIFTVSLDFGAGTLTGADRFLDIAVRISGGGTFTPLTPRQPLLSAPYAVRSLNAATADSLSVTGSGNFVQNSTKQQTADFNISGNGTAGGTLTGNIVDAGTEYRISGAQMLAGNLSTANTFVGIGAGVSNTTGDQNTFVGRGTGPGNTVGSFNTFLGAAAGNMNMGNYNTAVGRFAGLNNTSGSNNTLLGAGANVASSGLSYATAIGSDAVVSANNTIVMGRNNGMDTVQIPGNLTVFGTLSATLPPGSTNYIQNTNGFQSGASFSIGGNGSVSGTLSGTIVNSNTNFQLAGQRILGLASGTTSSTFAGIGSGTNATGPSNAFFGYQSGQNSMSGQANSFFGTQAGQNSTGSSNSFFGVAAGAASSGSSNSFFGEGSGAANTTGTKNTLLGESTNVTIGNLDHATAIGADATVSLSSRIVLGRSSRADTVEIPGLLYVGLLGSPGPIPLCFNNGLIATCSSSLRYKTNIESFLDGLDLVKRLRPISFEWKQDGVKDVGFGAEDVEKIDPRFVTYNDKGQVEGVKYDRLSVAFVNAFKEQQKHIEDLERSNTSQKERIEKQQEQIDRLVLLICSLKPDTGLCKKEKE